MGTVELTFSVPVCWSTMANATMSKCIEAAMREAEFGLIRDRHGSSVNLFMVNEAEAGASYALEFNQRDGVIPVLTHLSLQRTNVLTMLAYGGVSSRRQWRWHDRSRLTSNNVIWTFAPRKRDQPSLWYITS